VPEEFNDLKSKISAARGPDESPSKEPSENSRNMNQGMKAGTELVGAILGGALIGLLLDNWLGTKPLFLISLLVLGIGVGFFNVYKLSQNMSAVVGFSELHKREKQAKNPPDKEKQG
jgi:ATP synthase protein I